MDERLYQWILIAEEHARRIGEKLHEKRLCYGCTYVPYYIDFSKVEMECDELGRDCKVGARCDGCCLGMVPVALRFESEEGVNDEWIVEIRNGSKIMVRMPKLSGEKWVPLVTRTMYAFIGEYEYMWVRSPPADGMLAIRIEKEGCTIVSPMG